MKNITKQTVALVTALFLVTPYFAWAAGSGGGGGLPSTSSAPAREISPEKASAKEYRKGVRQKEKAWRQEEKAAKASTDKKRDKALEKAQKHYAKAVEYQGKALRLNSKNHEAANELGYALRKTGDFKKAIGAYNYALELKPDFYEAIEYRGEALLALGFIDESKEAYMTLFRNAPELAAQLMATMQSWHASQPASDDKEAFATWMEERQKLVEASNSLSAANARSW